MHGNPVIGDLSAMLDVLVVGSDGSEKFTCINNMLVSFPCQFRPDELRLALVDARGTEILPAAGADPNKEGNGKNALEHALSVNPKPSVVHLFRADGAHESSPMP